MNTEWLSPEQLSAWVRFIGVVELLPGALDSQLRRDAQLTHFDYYVLSQLSEAPGHTLRMTALADRTAATLARLSHVVQRLETRGLLERFPCPEDRRATNARLTADGLQKVRDSAPGHVATVREYVIDALTPEQVTQLGAISDAILARLDPGDDRTALYRRYDR
ncbi:MarR family transcriptional regulator [Actinoplanes italicus]|uniref:MarR family transcriptional regulator n=1 Tax=Actinoplanes italicus TaxID=113567 RepID=A0A2T0K2A9_9ACTN|nr:MarR family transcriptional regulator [Actinoplanes italicus]PRX16750.1 MarR family transcriptional regulator [Actinoplanes italicus]GIE31120.1 MarR family transcriptional regulator [Actinoplanes italicus]